MSIKRRDLIQYLEENGFRIIREGGNHTIYSNDNKIIPVKRHKAALKEKLIREIEEMPAEKVKKEDDWLIDLVNKRTKMAEVDRDSGKKFATLNELQKDYR